MLVVGASRQAADELVRSVVGKRGALFGWRRRSLDRVAGEYSLATLAARGLEPATALNATAVAARTAQMLRASGQLSHLHEVSTRPGFPVALARTLAELRMAGLDPHELRTSCPDATDLALLYERFLGELEALRLADRATLYRAAVESLEAAPAPRYDNVLLLDVRATSVLEARLVHAIAARSERLLATLPRGDERSVANLGAALRSIPVEIEPRARSALGSLQRHLFATQASPAPVRDSSVLLAGWPGIARECVEIARAIQERAAAGVPFDEMAVLVHAPAEYTAHLEESFRRAEIPAWFARGTRRPHPAGRALLALLACAAERLSARRFAEYLSLAQVPSPSAVAEASAATLASQRATATADLPADDLLPSRVAERVSEGVELPTEDGPASVEETGAAGVSAPWRWDRLLTDAAVIGGPERWQRRLAGLDAELREQLAGIEDHDEPRVAALEQRRRDLAELSDFALPLIERLAALPQSAPWGDWLAHLRELAVVALREPAPVLALFAELNPSGPVGPVSLDEVRIVLAPRLRELALPPARRRYGAVFVGMPEAARGLTFDSVFIPGLAERIFPGKIVEDPLFPDAARATLPSARLETQDDRAEAERLALRLAVGAARERVVLSYPRVDVEQARPRVPSFYLLEASRAMEGLLPDFTEVIAAAAGESRLGWPAPEEPERAIDDSEYDLALLAPLIGVDDDRTTGTARYLMSTNPHLARALRARGRRWLRAWTPADGLVDPPEEARAALARHQLAARSYSPTALQHFATCPYKFFLQALMRLAPPEEAVAIEVLDPLTRGAIFHDAQFETLTELRERGWLPLATRPVEELLEVGDTCLDRVVARERERLVPAIERVFEDAITLLKADLRQWLRREHAATDGFSPYRFELTFGVVDRDRRHADPASVAGPVPLDAGFLLRGAIDLVERDAAGRLRVTDHKTGRVRAEPGVVVGGGEVLQPVLYALAAERLLEAPVQAGRLYYCTAQGGYTDRTVPLDETARTAAVQVATIIAQSLQDGFLPAAPRAGACRACDYRPVCGPYEEQRVQRKPRARLAELERLRGLP